MTARINLVFKKIKGSNNASISFVNSTEDDIKRYQRNFCFVLHVTHHPTFFKNPIVSETGIALGSLPNPLVPIDDFFNKGADKSDYRSFVKPVVRDLICGLYHIHQRHIVLGDIHPKTVFVSTSTDVQIIYGDVSLATLVSTHHPQFPLPASVTKHEYFAPEIFSQNICSFASDTYSLGLLWMCIFIGKFVDVWNNVTKDDPRCILNEATQLSQSDDKDLHLLKYLLVLEPSRCMPLNIVQSLFFDIFDQSASMDHEENNFSFAIDLLSEDQLKDGTIMFLKELEGNPSTHKVDYYAPVFISHLVDKFYIGDSTYSAFLIREILKPFIQICLILLNNKKLDYCEKMPCCRKQLKMVSFLALHEEIDFFPVFEIFAVQKLIKITGPVVTELIKLRVCVSKIKSLTTKLGIKEWDELLESVASRDEELKRKLMEQSEEIQRCKKIRETLSSILAE